MWCAVARGRGCARWQPWNWCAPASAGGRRRCREVRGWVGRDAGRREWWCAGATQCGGRTAHRYTTRSAARQTRRSALCQCTAVQCLRAGLAAAPRGELGTSPRPPGGRGACRPLRSMAPGAASAVELRDGSHGGPARVGSRPTSEAPPRGRAGVHGTGHPWFALTRARPNQHVHAVCTTWHPCVQFSACCYGSECTAGRQVGAQAKRAGAQRRSGWPAVGRKNATNARIRPRVSGHCLGSICQTRGPPHQMGWTGDCWARGRQWAYGPEGPLRLGLRLPADSRSEALVS